MKLRKIAKIGLKVTPKGKPPTKNQASKQTKEKCLKKQQTNREEEQEKVCGEEQREMLYFWKSMFGFEREEKEMIVLNRCFFPARSDSK